MHAGSAGAIAAAARLAKDAPWRGVVEVTLILVIGLLAADLFWSLATPPAWSAGPIATVKPARPAQPAAAMARDIAAVDPFHRAVVPSAAPAAADAPRTTLDVKLHGVRAGVGAGSGTAIMGTPDGKQDAFRVGQDIMPGVRLENVRADRVLIRRNGVLESVLLDKERAAATIDQSTPTPQPASAPLLARDVMARLARLRVAPRPEGGVVIEAGDATLLEAAGLGVGDVLLAVNGTAIADAATLVRLAPELAKARQIAIERERAGQRNLHTLVIDQ
jgi:general secretion pathway protein C